jgi:hypothetical protein
MPIDYWIDPEQQLVRAEARGILTEKELFDYQRAVWSRPEVAGYNELFDMSEVEQIAQPESDQIKQLALLASSMDAPAPASRFAIVAPGALAFGLGRMYEVYRSLDDRSTKEVSVFRSMPEALTWLGINAPDRESETKRLDQ